MSKTSYAKAKGRSLQNWMAKQISKLAGYEYGSAGSDKPIEPRGMGQSGCDIRMHPEVLKQFPFSVECKHAKSINLATAIKQAQENVLPGTKWLVVVKRTSKTKDKRFGPVVVMDAKDFLEIWAELLDWRQE